MSETEKTNATPAAASEGDLDDLVSQLRQTINQTDWLLQNTSAKWEKENPELAKQWREALQAAQANATTEQ